MNDIRFIIFDVSFRVIALGFVWFSIQSLREKERRAAGIAFALAVAAGFVPEAVKLLPEPAKLAAFYVWIGLIIIAIVVYVIPSGKDRRSGGTPVKRVDERTVMFARKRLSPDSPQYNQYYSDHPEHKSKDDHIRSLPGLLSPNASKAQQLNFLTSKASFTLPEALRDHVDGPVASEQKSFSPSEITAYVKNVTRYFGARSVGVAELRPHHIYSHIGRGSGEYGAPITLDHTHAIAFTAEMDYDMMGPSPEAPEVMETAKQYAACAQTAVQLAALIRSLGYSARAHIDGNYRVIAPLVAKDAGLGEIGRMGILMTPDLGPRVRLGVVTTDLPLIADTPTEDHSMIDFCTICRKCADNCPSRSIPFDGRREYDGTFRWRIDPESCFQYWNVIGTDCGRCMAVCPYSHPDNATHNLVRMAIRRSAAGRRAALWMDDMFYGRKPSPRPAPEWTEVEMQVRKDEDHE